MNDKINPCNPCEHYNNGLGNDVECLDCWKISNAIKDWDIPLREVLIPDGNIDGRRGNIRVNYCDFISEKGGIAAIVSTLRSLNKRDRAIYALKIAMFSNEDVARLLNICAKTVQRRLSVIAIHTDPTPNPIYSRKNWRKRP